MTLEALPALRDNPIVMEQFMTGIDARVDGAKNGFKDQFTLLKSKNALPIKLIQVSVFGADLGGILARRFIDELLEEVCTKQGEDYIYEEQRSRSPLPGYLIALAAVHSIRVIP